MWDIIAAARYLKTKFPGKQISVAGDGRSGVLAIYASILEPEIETLELGALPRSLMDEGAPALLNALRVCDVPEALTLASARSIRLRNGTVPKRSEEIWAAGGARSPITK